MNNATKLEWFPVEVRDSGFGTDFIIREGDAVSGRVIGCYADLGTAYYMARLHNNHVSGNAILREVDLMFQSEIHFNVIGLWDGGIDWYVGLGGPRSDVACRGNEETIEEALVAMVNAARARYPSSTFARLFGGDVSVEADQRSVEDLARELGARCSLEYDPADFEQPWTCIVKTSSEADGVSVAVYSGATAEEALRAAAV